MDLERRVEILEQRLAMDSRYGTGLRRLDEVEHRVTGEMDRRLDRLETTAEEHRGGIWDLHLRVLGIERGSRRERGKERERERDREREREKGTPEPLFLEGSAEDEDEDEDEREIQREREREKERERRRWR